MLDPLSLRLGMSGIARRAHGTLRKFHIEINNQLDQSNCNGLLKAPQVENVVGLFCPSFEKLA